VCMCACSCVCFGHTKVGVYVCELMCGCTCVQDDKNAFNHDVKDV